MIYIDYDDGEYVLWGGELEPRVVRNESGPTILQAVMGTTVRFRELVLAMEVGQKLADKGRSVWLSEAVQYNRGCVPAGDGYDPLLPIPEDI